MNTWGDARVHWQSGNANGDSSAESHRAPRPARLRGLSRGHAAPDGDTEEACHPAQQEAPGVTAAGSSLPRLGKRSMRTPRDPATVLPRPGMAARRRVRERSEPPRAVPEARRPPQARPQGVGTYTRCSRLPNHRGSENKMRFPLFSEPFDGRQILSGADARASGICLCHLGGRLDVPCRGSGVWDRVALPGWDLTNPRGLTLHKLYL